MKITLLVVGKTSIEYLQSGIEIYQNRIKRYVNFQMEVIPALKNTKNLSEDEIKAKEGELILSKILPGEFVVLLDEKGKELSSIDFSSLISGKMLSGLKNLVFVIGGAYGFSPSIYTRFPERLRISSMTFSHQIIRLIFLEQLYRAFTILNNEPYHHE